MIRLSLSHDIGQLSQQLNKMRAELQDKAIAAAINRTADQAKTAAVRDITSTFNLRAADVRVRIEIKRATRRSINVEARLRTPGRRSLNLIRFAETKVTLAELRRRRKRDFRGLVIRVRRTGVRTELRHAWIGNNGRTIFDRVGKERYPIQALQALDVPQAMFSDVGVEHLKAAIETVFPKNLQHEIERLTRGLAR